MIMSSNDHAAQRPDITRWDNEGGAPGQRDRSRRHEKISALKTEIRSHGKAIQDLLSSGQKCPDASRALQRKKATLASLQLTRWPRLSLDFASRAFAAGK